MMMGRARLSFIAVAILVVVFAVRGCSRRGTTEEPPETPVVGVENHTGDDEPEMAPDLIVTDLEDNTLSLADARGKIVVLYFWATYCKPCVEKLPKMQAFYEAYGNKGVEIWALAEDPDVEMVKGWLQQQDLTIPIAMVGEEENEKFFPGKKILPIPQTIIVDGEGRIAERMGLDMTLEELEESIKKLLGEAE